MSRKTMKKRIISQKTLNDEKVALGSIDFSIANKYKKILEKLAEINILIKKRKNKDDRETLVDLIAQKALLQSQLKDWDEAGRPIDKKGFQIFLQEKCFQDEMRLPHTGDITFKNCILKGLRFYLSDSEKRKIKESIPLLTTNDYRIIVINGHGAIEGNVKVQTSSRSIKVSRAKSRPLVINQMPNGCWYFAQAFPGSSTLMCNRVDRAQFSNMNDPRKRDEFVSRLFTEGTFHTFMSGKTHEESDTAMVGIPKMPFHNKAWDFGESGWKERKTIMGIYDFTDPELNLQEDLTRRKDSDGFYIYHKHPESQDQSHYAPSDKLRNHLHMSDEPNNGAFHDVRKKKAKETYKAFVKKNNHKPVKGKDNIKGQFTYSLDEITQTYPLNREAANNKFKRVYRHKIFAADWAAVRRDGDSNIYDPMAKGSDGVSIRQRMIDAMERNGDINLTDVLTWFDPNAPGAVDRRKVIFVDWSCQPISIRVSVNGGNYSVANIDRLPSDYNKDDSEGDLIALQACRNGFEKMARRLNLIFNRVQSRFIEKNTGQTSIIRQAEMPPPEDLSRPPLPPLSPFTAQVDADPVYTTGVGALAGPTVRDAMDIEGGRRKKTRRKRRRKRRRKTRRKTKRK